jgi:hypothetical protein
MDVVGRPTEGHIIKPMASVVLLRLTLVPSNRFAPTPAPDLLAQASARKAIVDNAKKAPLHSARTSSIFVTLASTRDYAMIIKTADAG